MQQYDRTFPAANLTADAIEQNGELLLLRALNIRRAIAFVGSGVSVAYGRYGWIDLVKDIERRTIDKAEKECNGGASYSAQQQGLVGALKELGRSRNQHSGDILLLRVQL